MLPCAPVSLQLSAKNFNFYFTEDKASAHFSYTTGSFLNKTLPGGLEGGIPVSVRPNLWI
jgi:hypothetical protein